MNSMVRERERCVRTFVELPVALRPVIEDTIERLMQLLDEIDVDADAEEDDPQEDDGSAEPWLGAPESHPRSDSGMVVSADAGDQRRWAQGSSWDFEDEHDGREPDVDGEPWLGSVDTDDQRKWMLSGDGDREPELGATEDIDQINAWRTKETWDLDGEPMLGWTSLEASRGCRGSTDPARDELEIDAGDAREVDADLEPSIGSNQCIGSFRGSVDGALACVGGRIVTVLSDRFWDQSYWALGRTDEREWDASEGGEPDEGE